MANKNPGGRPRKGGGTAKPRLRNPNSGRMMKDTPANRKICGFGVDSTVAPEIVNDVKTSSDPGTTEKPKSVDPGLQRGHTAGAAAVAESIGGPTDGKQTAQTAAAPPAQIDYKGVVRVLDLIMTAQMSDLKMTNEEIDSIGLSLDQVILKHFPTLKEMGCEVALALAVGGWLTRVVLIPLLTAPPKPKDAHPKVPSTADGPELSGDPFAGTGSENGNGDGA